MKHLLPSFVLATLMATLPAGAQESPHIFGFHDPGGEEMIRAAGKTGWVLVTEGIGSNPDDHGSADYSGIARDGITAIVRLNNGYYPDGTIPGEARHGDFARRCANFVRGSKGCRIWIVGNEPNLAGERPQGEVITAERYVRCYHAVRDAIHAVAGHESDRVVVAAVANWNIETEYWMDYFRKVMAGVRGRSDGIAIHTYTHGIDPAFVTDETKPWPQYPDQRFHFRNYQDWMAAIPSDMRSLPVYLTETDQNDAWEDANRGWVRAAYAEIDRWNRTPDTQKIRCMLLYRWGNFDRWGIESKRGVHDDFRLALANDYRWTSGNGSPGLPDVVVSELRVDPAAPESARPASFAARVTNRGSGPVPADKYIGVGYLVDGRYVTWGAVRGPLAAGASVDVGTNGGPWTPPAPGTYRLTATADDVNRFAESDEGNNSREIVVAAGRPHTSAPFVREWLLLGPFAHSGNPAYQGHHIDFLGEVSARPSSGESAGGRVWTRHRSGADLIDLDAFFGRVDDATAYAHVYVRSPAARRALLSVGSDDAVKVWLGGRLVLDHYVGRAAAPDQDQVEVSLAAGWNPLLVKVTEGKGAWGSYLRLSTPEGRALPDLEYRLDRPGPAPGTRTLLSTGWEAGQSAGYSNRILYRRSVTGWFGTENPPPECGRREREIARTGTGALMIAGTSRASYAYCYYGVFRGPFSIERGTKLRYSIWHVGSAKVSVDGHLAGGGTLRDFRANGRPLADQAGVPIHPSARRDPIGRWHRVEIDLSPAAGRTLSVLSFAFDNGGDGFQGRYRAYVDDLELVVER